MPALKIGTKPTLAVISVRLKVEAEFGLCDEESLEEEIGEEIIRVGRFREASYMRIEVKDLMPSLNSLPPTSLPLISLNFDATRGWESRIWRFAILSFLLWVTFWLGPGIVESVPMGGMDDDDMVGLDEIVLRDRDRDRRCQIIVFV